MPMRDDKRKIVCAAIRVGDQIICGARHYDPVMRMQIESRSNTEDWRFAEQGFIDQWCVFMDRTEALNVAVDAGQVNREDTRYNRLFSEDLY